MKNSRQSHRYDIRFELYNFVILRNIQVVLKVGRDAEVVQYVSGCYLREDGRLYQRY